MFDTLKVPFRLIDDFANSPNGTQFYTVLDEALWGASDTYYVGASWTARYKGIRSDAQIYVGAGTLR